MGPVRTSDGQGPRRPHQACLNCRKKKVRCPGERPCCSSCVRLNQTCRYRSEDRPLPVGKPVEERLALVENQLSRILGGNTRNSDPESALEQLPSPTTEPLTRNTSAAIAQERQVSTLLFMEIDNNDCSSPCLSSVTKALDLYFQFCHGQPIWCLDQRTTEDPVILPDELSSSLLGLTCRFSPDLGEQQPHLDAARSAIMQHIAKGLVALSTLQALCLLSYSFFLDGHFHLGRFHVGIGSQLCRTAKLDLYSTFECDDLDLHIKRKVFWSFEVLEQTYGSQVGLLQMSDPRWQLSFNSTPNSTGRNNGDLQDNTGFLPLSSHDGETLDSWDHTVNLGSIWSMVRKYVSDAASNQTIVPWRHDSQYAKAISDLMELETRMPVCHRYDTVKFYERQPQEVEDNRDYWKPWLRSQFTYHAIHTVLNHPFLYTSISQSNSAFLQSNTFWRKSMELVLSHATWIARLVDMASEKQIRLTDPFFAHAAAIAATVHMYYCCSTSNRLKVKSRVDLEKCMVFVKEFTEFSPLCEALDTKLKQLLQVAADSPDVDLTQWTPTKIYLNSCLMWDILELLCATDSSSSAAPTLLHSSLQPPAAQDTRQNLTFEITVATSPEVAVQVSDGGQAAPLLSSTTNMTNSDLANGVDVNDIVVVPSENLKVNPSWLWQHYSEAPDIEDFESEDLSNSMMSGIWDPTWWEFGNL